MNSFMAAADEKAQPFNLVCERWLRTKYVVKPILFAESPERQLAGQDYDLVNLQTGEESTLELKVDLGSAKSGNMFLEFKQHQYGEDGYPVSGVYKCTATYYAIYLPESLVWSFDKRGLYIYRTHELKSWMKQNGSRFGERSTGASLNREGFNSFGYCIPIAAAPKPHEFVSLRTLEGCHEPG